MTFYHVYYLIYESSIIDYHLDTQSTLTKKKNPIFNKNKSNFAQSDDHTRS